MASHSSKLLQELAHACRQRSAVDADWGSAKLRPRGKCVTALFAGPSGTGKTLAAEGLARDLGLDIHHVDLTSIVDKYIGETEKHLQQVLSKAEKLNVVLFFDEADALFGKRSEVRDAHDRYANRETAYLLQRLEDYDGIVIISTNRRQDLDDAFIRRFRFVIEFAMPDAEHRK